MKRVSSCVKKYRKLYYAKLRFILNIHDKYKIYKNDVYIHVIVNHVITAADLIHFSAQIIRKLKKDSNKIF